MSRSNEIVAYFKGTTGVAESVYQYDNGMILVIDGLDFTSPFEVHFEHDGEVETVTEIGQENRVVIPNACLAVPGTVTAYIYEHTGQNDGETAYVIRFRVMGRTRPVDVVTEEQDSVISQAIALLKHPIQNIEVIVSEALSFVGETFAEMLEDLAEWKGGVEDGLDTWKSGVEDDFDSLQAQFETAISAVTTDTEVTNIRVGADGVTYDTAGNAIRTQFTDVKSALFDTTTESPESGYYYDNTGARKTNASWKTLKLRVENVFYDGYVHGTGSIAYYSTTYPSYIFMNGAGTVLDAKFVNVDNLSLITADQIPSGAEWIAFNSTNTFTVTIKGIYPILDSKIDNEVALRVPETNGSLDVSVSDYISALAENLYKRIFPVNLLHGTWTNGKIIGSDGTISDNSSYSYSDYFEISGNKKVCITRKITASTRAIEDYMSIAFYDKDKAFISRGTGLIKDVPVNAKYARQNVLNSYNTDNYKLMVEYTDNNGTIAPDYSEWFEPYFEVVSTGGSHYSNKKLCVFGDSLAANGGGGTDTWIQRVGDILEFEEVYNRGVGSSLVTEAITKYAYVDADGDAYNRLAYTTHQTVVGYTEIDACCSSVDRANTIPTDTDVLLILAGANDVGNTPLATFETAYRTMLDNIYARIPNAKVMVCTMPFHKAFDTGVSAETYENFRQAIRDAGHEYGFPVIDFKREMMVNKNNYTVFMDSDYVHYNNTNGRKRFAETAIPHVQEIKYANS